MRTVSELKKVADKLAIEAANNSESTVVIVAVADVAPKGEAHYHVSYAGGLLGVKGLVEKARVIVDRRLAVLDHTPDESDLTIASSIAAMDPEERIDAIAGALARARERGRTEG